MTIKVKFKCGDEAYLAHDIHQDRYMVTAITIRGGGISYELSCGAKIGWYSEFEMRASKDYSLN